MISRWFSKKRYEIRDVINTYRFDKSSSDDEITDYIMDIIVKSKTRKEMEEIVKQAPDLFEALAKDDITLIKENKK